MTILLTTLLLVFAAGPLLLRALVEPSPGGAIALTSTAYLVGAAAIYSADEDSTSLVVFSVALFFFSIYLVGYLGYSLALRRSTRPRTILHSIRDNLPSRVKVAALLFFLTATVIAILWAGTDRILDQIWEAVASGQPRGEILEMRVEFAGGEIQWKAPGYLKQLRDILLPLSVFIFLFSAPRGRIAFLFLFVLLVPLVAVLILSSGERGPVLFYITGLLYALAWAIRHKLYDRKLLIIPSVSLAAIGAVSFATLTGSYDTRQYEQADWIVFLDRILLRYPEENIFSYHVWADGTPFPGASWLAELASIAPGTQVTLSNVLHEFLGGSARGNSVLGLWIDVYFNFGWLLGVPVSLGLGVALASFDRWVHQCQQSSPSAALTGMWLSICMLFVLSPFGFVLYGGFVLSACLWAINRYDRTHSRDVRLQPDIIRPPEFQRN